MSDNSENTTNISSVRQDLVLQELLPTMGTFLKAFWSASWRANLYALLFLILFKLFLLFRNELIDIIVTIPCLFWAMRKLNHLHYSQGKDLLTLKITDKAIFFYLFLVLVPYLMGMVFSVVFFGKINEIVQLFLGLVPNLFIFYRMMTKGIMGFRIVTSRIIAKEGKS